MLVSSCFLGMKSPGNARWWLLYNIRALDTCYGLSVVITHRSLSLDTWSQGRGVFWLLYNLWAERTGQRKWISVGEDILTLLQMIQLSNLSSQISVAPPLSCLRVPPLLASMSMSLPFLPFCSCPAPSCLHDPPLPASMLFHPQGSSSPARAWVVFGFLYQLLSWMALCFICWVFSLIVLSAQLYHC